MSFVILFNFENYVELFNWSLKQKINNMSYQFELLVSGIFSYYKMNDRVIALMKLFIGNQVMESFEIFEIEKLVQIFVMNFGDPKKT